MDEKPKLEDLSDDDFIVVCNPTHAPRVKNVTIRQCDFCGGDVWLADSTKSALPEKYYIACGTCIEPTMDEAQFQLPTDEQIKDMAEHLGRSFDELKAEIVSVFEKRNKVVKHNNRAKKYEEN